MRRFSRLLCALLPLVLMLVASPVGANDLNNSSWSETDNNNNATPPAGWPAGMNPSQVEPTARSMMGGMKRFWNRINGTVTTTGSAGAYVYTPSNTSFPIAYAQGEIYTFKANFTSVGNDTLNVDSLGGLPIYRDASNKILAGDIATGTIVSVAYNSALNSGGGGFQLINTALGTFNGTISGATLGASGLNLNGETLSGNGTFSGTDTFSGTANISGTFELGGVAWGGGSSFTAGHLLCAYNTAGVSEDCGVAPITSLAASSLYGNPSGSPAAPSAMSIGALGEFSGTTFGPCTLLHGGALPATVQALQPINSTELYGVAGYTNGSTSNGVSFPIGGTLKNLTILEDSAPGGVAVDTYHIFYGSPSALTCTITGSAQQCSDTTHTVSITANGEIFLQATLSNSGVARGVGWSAELCNP